MVSIPSGLIAFSVLIVSIGMIGIAISGILWVLTQIAEDVNDHMPRLVVKDAEGLPETVKYHELPAILLNEIKKLHKRIEELEKMVN